LGKYIIFVNHELLRDLILLLRFGGSTHEFEGTLGEDDDIKAGPD